MIIMNKFQQTAFLLFTLCVALLGSCKPTPRTANDHRAETERLEDEHQVVSRTMDEAEVVSPTRQTAADLLYVCVTYRSYNPYRPWEMEAGHFVKTSGVYLGNGQVLTTAGKLPTATYLELRLPDQSRAVPARVIKVDPDTNLALVTVQHEDDADIFDKVSAHEVGEPLMIGDVAQLQSLINDTEPVQVDVRAESANEHAALIPLMTMRSHAPLPQMIEPGMPLLKNGRIVGLVHNYESNSQSLNIINAEMIRRFLLQESDSSGVPVIGGGMTLLNDPVFRKYLKLEDGTNGLYVSELVPVGSAAAAGIRKGDVIVSVEDMPVNASGVCNHPIYGKISVPMVIRSLKPCGESDTRWKAVPRERAAQPRCSRQVSHSPGKAGNSSTLRHVGRNAFSTTHTQLFRCSGGSSRLSSHFLCTSQTRCRGTSETGANRTCCAYALDPNSCNFGL